MVLSLKNRIIKLEKHDNVYLYFGKDANRLWNLLETEYDFQKGFFDSKMREKFNYNEKGQPIINGLTITFSYRNKNIYILYMPVFSKSKNRLIAAFSHEMLHIAIYMMQDEKMEIDLNTECLNKRMGRLITDGLDTIEHEKEKIKIARKDISSSNQLTFPFV